MRQFSAAFFLFLLCAFPATVQAKAFEGILSYNSDIRIQSDSSLLITDTIHVNSLQKNIRHGIYRSFPLHHRDTDGKPKNIGLQLVGVYHNGQPAPYRLRRTKDGKHLSIGAEDILLQQGQHSYKIIYNIRGALDFSHQHDKLRWNITGTEWALPLHDASLNIYPPEGAEITDYSITTDMEDKNAPKFYTEIDADGVLHSRSTTWLKDGNGITITATWPKGFLTLPTSLDKIIIYVAENFWSFTAFTATGIGGLLFFVIWLLVGRDPPRGTIIPAFAPPENFSPALAVYVTEQGSGETTLRRALCAAIASLAVKGFIKITLHGKDRYALDLIKPRLHLRNLPVAERVLAKCLFAGRTRRFMFASEKDIRFEMVLSGFGNALKRQSKNIYFAGNEKYVLASTAFTLLLSGWLFTGIWQGHIILQQGWSMIIGLLFLNLVYYFLMKAPTSRGRWKMDRLEGFKMYLAVAENDRLDFLNPSVMSPELFERFLPYAIGFDIEKSWMEKFKKSVPKAVYNNYKPRWFVSEAAQMALPKICLALGTGLQTTLASAAQLPGQITTAKVMKKAAIMKAGGGIGSGTGGGW